MQCSLFLTTVDCFRDAYESENTLIGRLSACKCNIAISYNTFSHALPNMYARSLRYHAYISGKALTPILRLLHNSNNSLV